MDEALRLIGSCYDVEFISFRFVFDVFYIDLVNYFLLKL